jgi:hypothetical protein
MIDYVLNSLATYLILFGLTVRPLYSRHQAWPRPVAGPERQQQQFKHRSGGGGGNSRDNSCQVCVQILKNLFVLSILLVSVLALSIV